MLPKLIIHNEVSLDGRIDWFTPHPGTYYRLAGEFDADAHLTGADTLLSSAEELPPEDEDLLVSPEVSDDDPGSLLVVVDSRGRVRHWRTLRHAGYWRRFVALCAESTPRDYVEYLAAHHVDAIVAGRERVDLRAALEQLQARYGVARVHVDSGGTLNGALLRAGLVDEISLLIAPALVGGLSPRSFYRAPDLTSPEGVIPLELFHVETLDEGLVWLRYRVIR
jgi:2,5-diamino-6-(ribosylamino)-4(3H)-pyrimidinone 5'-phosphate reductase